MAKILVDLDDVVFPWARPVHEACRRAGLHDQDEWDSWHMWESYGCTKEEWEEVMFKIMADGHHRTIVPTSDALSALLKLYWEGHEIHIVTARSEEHAREDTEYALEEYAIPHSSLTFTHDKATVALGLGLTYAIDDGVHNIAALQEVGVEAYLLDQPHNRSFQTDKRVFSVSEFADIISKKEGQR